MGQVKLLATLIQYCDYEQETFMYSSPNVFRCGNKTQILPLPDTED